MMSAAGHASIACGPASPAALISSGIVMNGPMPTMFDMFSAVACQKPMPRWSSGSRVGLGGSAGERGAVTEKLPRSQYERAAFAERKTAQGAVTEKVLA